MNRRGFLRTALCAAGATTSAMALGKVEAKAPTLKPAPNTSIGGTVSGTPFTVGDLTRHTHPIPLKSPFPITNGNAITINVPSMSLSEADTRKQMFVNMGTSIGRNSLRIYDGDDPDAVLGSLLSGISTDKHCLRIRDAGIFRREDGLYAEVEAEWGGLTSRIRLT